MEIGTRVKLKDAGGITGTITESEHYQAFVNMNGKVFVRWDKPRGKRKIAAETIYESQLVTI